MKVPFNSRVLVIDDEESIRDSFREILMPTRRDYSALDAAGETLFGEPARQPVGAQTFQIELDEADSGRRGIELVRRSVEQDRPYAAIFVDIRMPGWDGLDTVQHIREHDKRAEIIFITAYSDYSIDEIVSKAGANVGYQTKPYAPEEIRQLATKAIYEWNKTRGLEDLIHVISDLRATEAEVDLLLHNILHQVSDLVGSGSALLAVRQDDQYRKLIGIGVLADDEVALKHLRELPTVSGDEVYQGETFIYFPMDRYGVFALFESDRGPLRNDRIYMVQLFLEQATQAIRNAELREELLRAERLSAMGQGVGVVAHDLRNPLNGILSIVELMNMENRVDEESKTYLAMIRDGAQNAIAIVNDILDFARESRVEGSPASADEILDNVRRLVAEPAEHSDVDVEIHGENADFALIVDATKIERILVNLVRNAIEAMSGEHQRTGTRVEVWARAEGEDVVFEVSDDGPGIPEELRSRLFVPFATGGKPGGTGLGLPIVKQFVTAHDGTINVDSSESGTRFVIRLPGRVRAHRDA